MSMRTTKLLIAAATTAVASGAEFAQPELAATDPQTQLLEQIAELRAEVGPTPAGLIEPLRALALLYEEGGDHALAIVALEEARRVTRVHHGLSSADEALLLRQQIRSEEALGLHERVWTLEQDMATIARQLSWANRRRSDFAAFPAQIRLARLLVEIAEVCGRPRPAKKRSSSASAPPRS